MGMSSAHYVLRMAEFAGKPWRAVMIVEYARYKIDEQRCSVFESAYKKAVESLGASSHCLAYELSHCKEDPEHYTLRIEWDSEEGHLKGFRTSPEFKSFFASVQSYVKDIEEMRHYQVISAGRKSS
jgi:quinol monooxygenase YgiN